MFDDFHGNAAAQAALQRMIEGGRIAQTILLAGPEGVGKATLARRFAARILGGGRRIENDDLSLPHNAAAIADREKWPSEKRSADPLLFASHPDFLTFPPEGPLRQISIQQIRLLKERAQFNPLKGSRRVFLIDQIDRANEQAANSLLKTLEEPPAFLLVVMTATNAFDLLPTIRSRSVTLQMAPLDEESMRAFAATRNLSEPDRRIALAAGCPGVAAAVDLAAYSKRREAMLALLRAASGVSGFADWAIASEKVAQARSEKLDGYLRVLYLLLEDVLHAREGIAALRNPDARAELEDIARRVTIGWLRAAVRRVDELMDLVRRNIQKNSALDALVVELREAAA
jgi:DNA polymerase-3 subunit delta'